jgi:uncharacterized protein YndB with AHSA1/START domain
MTTLVHSYHVFIRAPRERVFDYVADLTRHPEWSGGELRIEALTPGPVAVGSQYSSHGSVAAEKNRANTVRVSEYQPPARFGFIAQDPGFGNVVHEFIFTSEGDGTHVERKVTTNMSPVMAFLFQLMIRPLIGKPMMDRSLAALKARLERM